MMKIVADVHLHSHYSRATSQNLDFEHLSQWAQLKGVTVVGTGDIAHPGWLQEMKDKLEPAEDGLFRLKAEIAQAVQAEVPPACQAPVRFMLAGEISSIYKKNDRVRKVHNVIFAPSLEAVEKIQAALEKIGNIRSDGRPILGLPSRDLLEIILGIDPACYLIPAHIWTPWFSLLGSKSGYDSVEECFEDLTPHIFALETGLSSDPPMNWRVSALDRYTLVSNSDAHSPQKLAREATVFETELSYPAIFNALKSGDPELFRGTVEFFPEEGKYHHDGHRKCNINWDPKETITHKGRCPVCGKPVTVGVLHRVEALADRAEGERPERIHPFYNLIPLPEILAEVYRVGPTAKQVQQDYELLLNKLGPELSILQDIPLDEIDRLGGPLLAEGIRRMRSGEVAITAGYDGEYGLIKLFGQDERDAAAGQLSFMPTPEKPKKAGQSDRAASSAVAEAGANYQAGQTSPQWTQASLFDAPEVDSWQSDEMEINDLLAGLNPEQQAAVLSPASRLIIVAGPGTGKTRTLTYRIAHLIDKKGVAPNTILAITFTNKVAEEMAARLRNLIGDDLTGQITLKTFHAFGAMLLREAGEKIGLPPNFAICSEQERQTILKQGYPEWSTREINLRLDDISAAKSQCLAPDEVGSDLTEIYQTYQKALQKNGLVDFDDLVFKPVQLLENHPDLQRAIQERFKWISVDEFQDVNQAQYRLLQLLIGPDSNVCLIGDPDQAIYGFRGATPKYFHQFSQDFGPVETLHLNRNYRSTQLILDASEQVIEKNPVSERVKIWSDFVDQTKLVVHQAASDRAEAEYTVQEIEKMMGGISYFSIDSGRSDNEEKSLTFADFAVFYRLSAQSQPLIEAFQRSGIPYQSVGQTPLTEYKDIQMVLACLWFLHNPDSTFHLETVLPKKKQRNQMISFLRDLRGQVAPHSVASMIGLIHRFTLEQRIQPLEEERTERVQQLVRRATPFENRLADFLESTVLQKETDLYDPRADRVTLMTLHAAKGLEFPVVFIVGCEEGLIPYQMEGRTYDLAEERRLFYVGMTRAQEKLVLTHAKTRFLFGQKRQAEPSRFLNDIEEALIEIKKMAPRRPAKETPETVQLKLF